MPNETRTLLLRFGLVSHGIAALGIAYRVLHYVAILDDFAMLLYGCLGVIGMGMVILATLQSPRRALVSMILVASLLSILGNAYITHYHKDFLFTDRPDNAMIAEYAVHVLARGENPYTWDYTDARRVYRDRGLWTTPFLDNSVQFRVTYPAFPTLVLFGAHMLGFGDAQVLAVIALLTIFSLVFFGSPADYRPVALLPLLILADMQFTSLAGIQDAVWSASLLAMLLMWRFPVIRALFFGIAANYRQQPWFILPFLLITIWRSDLTIQEKRREISLMLALPALIFAMSNLPFIIWDADAWLVGAIEPAYANFNLLSQGLASVSQYGVVALPKSVFSGLQFSTLLAFLWVTWRHPHAIGSAYWALPPIFFWLYYRGLGNYWFYWLPPMILVILKSAGHIKPISFSCSARHQRTFAAIAVLFILNGFHIGYWVAEPAPSVLSNPHNLSVWESEDGIPRLASLSVEVINRGDAPLVPRFSLETEDPPGGLPWFIDDGADILYSGQRGTYRISARASLFAMPSLDNAAQIVLTDAGGNYDMRAVLKIPPINYQPHTGDLINGDFALWIEYAGYPFGWKLSDDAQAIVSSFHVQNTQGIALSTIPDGGIATLSQTIRWTDKIELSLYRAWQHHALAIQLSDGTHDLTLFYGTADGQLQFHEDRAIIFSSIPRHRWYKVRINPTELWQDLGWATPQYHLDAFPQGGAGRQLTLTLVGWDHLDGFANMVVEPIDFAAERAAYRKQIDNQ